MSPTLNKAKLAEYGALAAPDDAEDDALLRQLMQVQTEQFEKLAASIAAYEQPASGNPYWDLYADRIVVDEGRKIGDFVIRKPSRYINAYEFDTSNPSGVPNPDVALARLMGIGSAERFECIALYGFTVASPDLVSFIAEHSGGRLIDPMAGTGYMPWLLRQEGVDVLAYDNARAMVTWGTIHRGHAPYTVARHGRDRALLLSWPSQNDAVGFQTLAAYRGDTVIYVGEYASCGDQQLYKLLDWGWYPVERLDPVRWGGLHDIAVVFKRRPPFTVPRIGRLKDEIRATAARGLLALGHKFLDDLDPRVEAVLDEVPPMPSAKITRPSVCSPEVEWFDTPPVDDYGTVTLGRWGGWLLQVLVMIFNDRLVLTPENDPMFHDYGWCFRKGGAASLAAYAWNPATEAEPAGYIKAVRPGRKPGETAKG